MTPVKKWAGSDNRITPNRAAQDREAAAWSHARQAIGLGGRAPEGGYSKAAEAKAKSAQDAAEKLGTSKKAWLAAAAAWKAFANEVSMNKDLEAKYQAKARAAEKQASYY